MTTFRVLMGEVCYGSLDNLWRSQTGRFGAFGTRFSRFMAVYRVCTTVAIVTKFPQLANNVFGSLLSSRPRLSKVTRASKVVTSKMIHQILYTCTLLL